MRGSLEVGHRRSRFFLHLGSAIHSNGVTGRLRFLVVIEWLSDKLELCFLVYNSGDDRRWLFMVLSLAPESFFPQIPQNIGSQWPRLAWA